MLPRLHAFDPQSTAHCTSSHNGQTRASASPRTGRPLWVSARRISISVEAVSTSSEVPTFPYPLPLSMTEHFWVLVLLCPLTRPSARRAIPWSDVVFLPPEARSQPVSPQPHKKGLPLTPHGLVCKTPVTTHACLLGSACTASRRCLLLPKTERPRVWCTQHLSKSSGLPHISTHTSDHNIDATRSTSTGRRDYVHRGRPIPAPAGRHRSAAGKRAHRGRGRRQAPAAPRSEPHRATSIRPEPLPGQRHSLPTPSRG